MFKKIQLLFNTIKYLKAGQILNRIKRKLIKPKVSLLGIPEKSFPSGNIKPFVQRSQKIYGEGSFKFLNKEFILKTSKDWNAKNQDKLWLYNLHYFDDLNAVNSEQRITWHINLIQKWIDDNPLGFANGWEPYPSSLRIINWIKWFLLGNFPEQRWLDSLVIQVRFLSKNLEYHLLGNHLFSNAKALVFAGLFFKGKEANYWYQLGISIINKELPEQILSDGGNFELSPMYHAIFLEDLLDLVNIHKAYDRSLLNSLEDKIIPMLNWLRVMCHPDDEVAFFNDATFGVAPSFADLVSYADRLNIIFKNNQVRQKQLVHLEDSGFIRVENESMVMIVDVADIGPDYIPGHGHADALSFEMSLFGKRVIVNSGISTYEKGINRSKQRSTKSHSTITIDNQDSSEVWGGFRVAKRAKVFNITNIKVGKNYNLSACHDGYKRLKGRPIHCRKWYISENILEIVDEITGSGVHEIISVLPLHPEVVLSNVQNHSVELEIKKKKIKVNIEGNGLLRAVPAKYHPEFGVSVDNKQLIYSYNGSLPFKAVIKISW